MKKQPPQADPLARFIDLLSGRLHSRVITLTQKVNEGVMQGKELEKKLQQMGHQLGENVDIIRKGLEELRSKADDEDVDFSDELAQMDGAMAALDQVAASFQSVAPETGTTVATGTEGTGPNPPPDVTGISQEDAGQGTAGTSPVGGGPSGAAGTTAASESDQPISGRAVDVDTAQDADTSFSQVRAPHTSGEPGEGSSNR